MQLIKLLTKLIRFFILSVAILGVVIYVGMVLFMSLVILFPIFNPLRGGMTDARTAIQSCLREVHTRGYGLCLKESVNFKAGDILLRKELLMEVPISETALTLLCKDKDICTKDLIVLDKTDNGTRMSVGSGITAHIAACTDGEKYVVTISRDKNKVSEDCLTVVNIKP